MTALAPRSSSARPAFKSILKPRHFKNYFYFNSQYYTFDKLAVEFVGFKTPDTLPVVTSTEELYGHIQRWNLQGPSETKERGYAYELRFSEYQLKEEFSKRFSGSWPKGADLTVKQKAFMVNMHPKTLTMCQTPQALYERLRTSEHPIWYNPTRQGERQTVREFCYYNGFAAAAFLRVQDGDKTLTVEPDSTKGLDSWLQGEAILNRTIPTLYGRPDGAEPPKQGDGPRFTSISMDAVILEE